VEEEDVRNHLYRNGFTGGAYKTIHRSCSKQAAMRGRKRLPDAGEHDEDRERQADSSAAEDVAERNNDKVREPKGDDSDASEKGDLRVIEVELLREQRKHGCNGECASDRNPSEEPLAGHSRNCHRLDEIQC
jgi:hypothetical protein